EQGYGEAESSATIIVARDPAGAYLVQAGNVVEEADGHALVADVARLATLDKAALKAAYKEQLRRPREESTSSGAGLGLIDIARKSSQALTARLTTLPDGKAFFSLKAVI